MVHMLWINHCVKVWRWKWSRCSWCSPLSASAPPKLLSGVTETQDEEKGPRSRLVDKAEGPRAGRALTGSAKRRARRRTQTQYKNRHNLILHTCTQEHPSPSAGKVVLQQKHRHTCKLCKLRGSKPGHTAPQRTLGIAPLEMKSVVQSNNKSRSF